MSIYFSLILYLYLNIFNYSLERNLMKLFNVPQNEYLNFPLPLIVFNGVIFCDILISRSTRESTPCSLIRDSNTIGTPGSTTRQGSSTTTNRRVRNVIQRNNPTTEDMEEFFACAEQKQQRLFIEKYDLMLFPHQNYAIVHAYLFL